MVGALSNEPNDCLGDAWGRLRPWMITHAAAVKTALPDAGAEMDVMEANITGLRKNWVRLNNMLASQPEPSGQVECSANR
jgi:hypothetical protein